MKNLFTLENFKKYRDVLYFIVIVILAYLVFFYAKREKVIQITETNNKALYDSALKVIRARDTRIYTEIQQRRLSESEYLQRIDSLAYLLKIKPKFVKGEDSYTYRKDTFFFPKPIAVYIDRDVAGYSVRKKDNYVDIYAVAGKDTGYISYTSIDTLTRLETSKTNIFGKTTSTVIIRNANPYNRIQSGYSYIQKPKRAWLTIGPSVQVNPFTKKMDIGVSLQWPIIQFKK